ncbi:VRR-NUC domain-containing protein [Durotheca rogersii]|uniref:VRR-NUC domain-containing protein n=1 Tax=Durotheca rogersii TaxID=419775 RepID=UPI00221F1010|nr:VRR-NUC domain-containing protein [Durotheca rogersii]KAI5862102.1 VRR-NUC domain-containing protein [Durotheca rogersii]
MDAFLIRRPPPASRRQHVQTASEPPPKRVKRQESYSGDEDTDQDTRSDSSLAADPSLGAARYHGAPGPAADDGDDSERSDPEAEEIAPRRPTAIESSLPEVKSGREALQEYEAFKASQNDDDDADASVASPTSRLNSRKWVKGKTSIYVDAFNLALDTVLDEESHLFNAREMYIFDQWKGLDYAAQYLYVRLFLRKTALWHRVSRLRYRDDIPDIEAAVDELQKTRDLPSSPPSSPSGVDSAGLELEGTPPAQEQCVFDDRFAFADVSEHFINSVEEAVALLSLDEIRALAKEAKVQGKNKAELARSICRMSSQQTGLFSLGLRRSGTVRSADSPARDTPELDSPGAGSRDDLNRRRHFLEKIVAIAGPCVRLSLPVFKLFERVHLVFYRSTEWTEKSLTTIILAKISKRNFPDYVVARSANIFASRAQLLEFEAAIRAEYAVDNILEFNGPVTEEGHRKVMEIFEQIYPRWKVLLCEEQEKEERVYEPGEGAYLRRFNAAHPYTRIVHKAAQVLGKLKEHGREHELLTEMLGQRLFHPGRRGSWYQRKALLEERYMHALSPAPACGGSEAQKKHWRRIAAATCEAALEDRDCHLVYHHDLQKRLVKLERQLKVPRRLQHDFGHVRLRAPEAHVVEGVQLKRREKAGARDELTGRKRREWGPSTRTVWVDESAAEGGAAGGAECGVEAMCLNWYRARGWKGYHAEGGIVRTLFALLFYDVLFLYVPNVFQTPYQTCPLDLRTDAFAAARASEINHRLAAIANGGGGGGDSSDGASEAARLVAAADARERPRRTCVAGLDWDAYGRDELVELAACFAGGALAAVCRVLAQEHGGGGGGGGTGGMPDLLLWRTEPRREVLFAEVKSAGDRLSDAQRLWIDVLAGAGVRVAVCRAVAREVREV